MRLVVDGYNVVHAWSDLKALLPESLEFARDRLVQRLGLLAAVTGDEVTVVFDAHRTQSALPSEEMKDGVRVLFTRRGLSADHVIERQAFLAREEREPIMVATSDRFHADMLRGLGAAVIGASELERQVAEAEAEMQRRLRRYAGS